MGTVEMNVMLKDFYKGKRVLVTGHTGFKGSWLALWLTALGADVAGFSLPPAGKNDHFVLLGLEGLMNSRTGDIRDGALLKSVFDEFRPEIVFHLAAQALVRRSYNEPKYTFDTNVGGSVNVLEAVRATPGIRSVVYITSDKCYHNKEWVWGYRETDELGGEDPYSASKAAAEIVYHAYQASFFSQRPDLGVATARAGNVIGGGDWSEDRIVPDTIRSLRDGQPVVLRNPASTRPWQHVLEPLSGYLALAQALYRSPQEFAGSWNFGPTVDSIKTVRDLAEKIKDTWGAGKIVVQPQAHAPHEAGLLHLNCDKSHQRLCWSPRWGFSRGVEKTVEWYKRVLAGDPAASVTGAHIREYMEALS